MKRNLFLLLCLGVATIAASPTVRAGQPGPIGHFARASCNGEPPGDPMQAALVVEPGLAAAGIGLQSHYRDLNGTCIHWVEAGAANERLIVLLHGYPQFWASWAKVLPHLVAAGFRVLMPDMRGVNGSARPEDPAAYRQQIIARDVLTLIAHYRNITGRPRMQAQVVAYDTGGMTGWYLASDPGDLISGVSIINFPHPRLYRRDLLLADRNQRNFSQYPLSFFVFGQAYIPDLAVQYFLQEGEFSMLRDYWHPGLLAEGGRFLQDKPLPVSPVLAAAGGVGAEGAATFSRLRDHEHPRLREYARRYAVVFHRLNYEMRWLRMGFDAAEGRPFRMLQSHWHRNSTFTLAEVKLYTDAIMRDFNAETSQLHDWFRFFKAMTLPAPEMGFLAIPASGFVPDRGLRTPADFGRWTAICSILERELPGAFDRMYGPYERSWMGALVRVGHGIEEGLNIAGDPRVRFLAERLTKIFTDLNLGDWPDGVCQNDALMRGLRAQDDPYALPPIQIPVQLLWGYHDAYLNTENFFDRDAHAALFADPARDFATVAFGERVFDSPAQVKQRTQVPGSHWTIDEFPEAVAGQVIDFATQSIR